MDIRYRRVLAIFFFLFFLVCAPLVIAYALGYKFNPAKVTWEKTGVFYVKSFPKSADVYLNGNLTNQKTPTRFTRLLPNMYQVKIGKEGYLDWVKNLSIEPQLTTFIEDVSLFLNEPKPTLIQSGNFTLADISTDSKNLAVFSQENKNSQIWLYRTDKDEIKSLWQSQQLAKAKSLTWSPNNQKLLFGVNDDYLIFNVDGNALYPSLSKLLGHKYSKIIWSDINDNLLYASRQNKLYQLDLLQKKETLIIDSPIATFAPYFGKLAFVEKNSNGNLLKLYDNKEITTLLKLPESENYEISSTPEKYLILKDIDLAYLYLLDPSNQTDPLNAMFKYVTGFNWRSQKLVFWNESELWVYYPDSKQKILVERTSQKIANAQLLPNAVYVIASIDGKIKIYELDGRDKRNSYELSNLTTSDLPFYLDEKGQHLFLLDNLADQKGLYAARIQ